ncbi:hypothetical protein BH10PSE14_BH10PSE14_22210 [soil metagenome]
MNINDKNNSESTDLDDVMTDLMQGHLDDVSGASSSHNSWRQHLAASTAE